MNEKKLIAVFLIALMEIKGETYIQNPSLKIVNKPNVICKELHLQKA